jgi:uncharacterized OB-fold protein
MTTPAKERVIPTPAINAESKPFYEAAANGKFLYGYCKACKKPHFYPRSICPFCFSDDTEMKESSGKGVIYSHSTMRRAPEPYTLAYVTIAEGPTCLTGIVDCDPDKLKIGQKVHVVFKASKDGPMVPAFALD